MSTTNIDAKILSQKSVSHVNHMGGESYHPSPLMKAEMMMLSGFLGEPTYYNPVTKSSDEVHTPAHDSSILISYLIGADTRDRKVQFYEAINHALDYDFMGTLNLIVRSRNEFMMRRSPAQAIAIAAAHPNRQSFNEANPSVFRDAVVKSCPLPGDMIAILDAWKSLKGSKSGFPSFLKRSFDDRLGKATAYQTAKYPRQSRDSVRISHSSPTTLVQELMTTGSVEVDEKDTKWETLRSNGKSWRETLDILEWKLPHMAALRNLRSFAISVRDEEMIRRYCKMLENGVHGGKQFPFRYISALEAVNASITPKKFGSKGGKGFKGGKAGTTNPVKYHPKPMRQRDAEIIRESLEICLQKSIANHPKLEGDVVVLSDNSGSAWGAFTSEYGSKTVADIGNLSALITAMSCTGRGMIGLFGDRLLEYEVDKNRPLLDQYQEMKTLAGSRGSNVGVSTENGIWLFFKRAFADPESYRFDHFFCYSDMQAGHGGLYGDDPDMDDEWLWSPSSNQYRHSTRHIHVPKLMNHYREKINSKMSCFMVQTAGYNDSIMPETMYRGAILNGWTGREVVYAKNMLDLWDKFDSA